jgi:hypothetical protein
MALGKRANTHTGRKHVTLISEDGSSMHLTRSEHVNLFINRESIWEMDIPDNIIRMNPGDTFDIRFTANFLEGIL